MAEEASEPTRVEIETTEWRGAVTLAESLPGGGDWSVVGVEVSSLDGSALSAARLRAVPWGELLDRARGEVAGPSRRSPFIDPNDVRLAAFAVDRRGRAARTERDYAELAEAWLGVPATERHRAAARWAEKYGNRSAQRWRMDIRRAKGYVEEGEELVLDRTTGEWVKVPGLVLTEKAWKLIYGDDIFDVTELENAIEQTEGNIEQLSDLGDGTAESAQTLYRAGRRARELSRQHGVTVSLKAVLDAWLMQEREKLIGVNSPHAPE